MDRLVSGLERSNLREITSFRVSTETFVRLSALKWADLLAQCATYVMMNYLTNVWNLSTTHAAGIINIWEGIKPVLTAVFAIFLDSFVGELYMLVFSSITYSIGLGLLSLSTPAVFGPCHNYKVECIGHTQKLLFYTALPLIAIGKAGQEASLPRFRKQEDKTKFENENVKKHGAINKKKIFYYTIVVVVVIIGGIVLPYIKPWSIRFGIPAICSVAATFLLFTRIQDYERTEPTTESPLTTTMRVFVATARKISQPIPTPDQELYDAVTKSPLQDYDARSTSSIRCLDKATIMLPGEQLSDRWKVCSVQEVEDTKIIIRLVRVWLTFLVIGIVLSTGTTYFLEQADHMDHKLGNLKVFNPIFQLYYYVASKIFGYFYTTWKRRIQKRFQRMKPYAPPIGIATSMVFCVLCCITAAKVETQRLLQIRDHGLLDKPNEMIPMSIFALVPQYTLLAAANGIAKKSMSDFFKDQTPKSMHAYLNYLTNGVLGLGRMAGVLSVYVVEKVSERNQKPNWFQNTLNKSHLDRYYWVLAGLSTVNLIGYVIVAYFYKYKESSEDGDDETEEGEIRKALDFVRGFCY